MKVISGEKYLSPKEASQRYGFSKSWFDHRRAVNLEPYYVRFCGRILYPISNTDSWFKLKLSVNIDNA